MKNIRWVYVLRYLVLHEIKLNILGLWTLGRTKQDI